MKHYPVQSHKDELILELEVKSYCSPSGVSCDVVSKLAAQTEVDRKPLYYQRIAQMPWAMGSQVPEEKQENRQQSSMWTKDPHHVSDTSAVNDLSTGYGENIIQLLPK